MTDIVEQLRASADGAETSGFTDAAEILHEAADEIERLRHEEMRLRTALEYHVNELREARRDIDRLRAEVAKLHDALDRMVNPKRPDTNISVRVEGRRKP